MDTCEHAESVRIDAEDLPDIVRAAIDLAADYIDPDTP